MKFDIATCLLVSAPMTAAFMVPTNKGQVTNIHQKGTASPDTETQKKESKPLFDPLNLYPESSEEKQQGRIRVLEPQLDVVKPLKDPLGLYPKGSPEYLQGRLEDLEARMTGMEQALYDPMSLYSKDSEERQQGLIQAMEPPIEISKSVKDPMGIYPSSSEEFIESMELERESITMAANKELYDPLGLYPASSPEYQEGKIKTLEPPLKVNKPVVDPLNLYTSSQSAKEVDDDVVMSEALPFMAKPAVLDGELVGDSGFDPLGFAKSKEDLLSLRVAELKHARIAMLAAAGWPLSELWDQKLAGLLHLKPLLVDGDRVPSLLNGGLAHVNPFYWLGVLGIAGFFEALDMMKEKNASPTVFDPLNLYPEDVEGQERMQLAEIKNGRVAMIAITAFALFEAVTKQAVVNGTPFFFHPPF